MSGLTLDAGALIGLERGNRSVIALLAAASDTSATVTVPATVLAQVVRAPQRQVVITRLLRASSTAVASLDHPSAVAVGRLLAQSGTADIVDAHVVVTAASNGDAAITSDAYDLGPLAEIASQPPVRIVAI